MKRFVRLLTIIVLLCSLFPASSGEAAPRMQASSPKERAQMMLDTLTPQERVGQLFLVTFNGPEGGPSSLIYELVSQYHIGGIMLLAENDNFKALDQTLPIAVSLTRQLQVAKYNASQEERIDPVSGQAYRPAFIPVLAATSQDGDGYPFDQIIGDFANGLTPLPSPMAVGATWQPDLARKMGNVLGSELAALGINLLIGPSLDVLDDQAVNNIGEMGVRMFGGSPFWVGEMGKSYITGLHQGSQGRLAVVSQHFPGYGNVLRLLDEEIPTVNRTLDQLKLQDLVPFYAVTGNAPTPEATTDAVLLSHIRYQGLQGNIRLTSKPLSLDRQAITQLMELPMISPWRAAGGVAISDDLGSQAVRRYYESLGQNYSSRYVARDALLAGNDLLYISNFTSFDAQDSYTGLLRTLEYFTQRYREDSLFAARVDEAVLRILTLKYKLYPTFTLTNSLAARTLPANIGKSSQVTLEVAQNGATLISPSLSTLSETLPEPPGRNERILFITDNRTTRQCSTCPVQSVFGANPQEALKALENVVVRLYSPQAGGQVMPTNLQSYSFSNLEELLNVGTGVVEIEQALRQANWVVFLMLDEDITNSSTLALERFLEERPDLIQQKNLIVFALNGPYYLDATEISKLTAYYALYSKAPRVLEVAARLLFQEITPVGKSPVSIPGVGYNLREVIQPAPNQNIEVLLDTPPSLPAEATITPSPTVVPEYQLGDTVPVRTSPIIDYNLHRVPDNTVVHFILTRGDGSLVQSIEALTTNGVARAVVRIESPGALRVTAESGLARSTNSLQLNTRLETNGEPPTATATPTPTQTPSPTPTPTLTPTPEPTPVIMAPPPRVELSDWFLAVSLAGALGLATYFVAFMLGQVRWGLRGGLLTLIFGLMAYLYLALGLPGSLDLLKNAGSEGVLGVTLLGIGVGWGATWSWKGLQDLRRS